MQPDPRPKLQRPGEELVGTVLRGKWHVDAVLGTGGMATVVSATHKINGRRVALKLLHRVFAGDPAARERFLRESYLGNKVPHRGRVEVFDDDVTDEGVPFLVMGLLEGETIAQLQRRLGKRLPMELALDLAEQLLDVLASCHEHAVLHLDLKPANVLVTPDGVVKLLDFGVAQLRDDEDEARAGMALGTPSFMSPEQARGEADKLDGRADIFSVGAMLYFMLSGVRLYKGLDTDEAMNRSASCQAPSLAEIAADLPRPVVAIVDRALAFERERRFSSAAEMRAAVLAILSTLRARASGRTPVPPAPVASAAATLQGDGQQAAVAAPREAAAFSGDLSRSPLPHLLINLLQRGMTGALSLVEGSGARHWICFVEGAAHKLHSSATRDGAPLLLRIAALGGLPPETRYEFFTDHDALPGATPLPTEPLAVIFRAIIAWRDPARKSESLKRLGELPLALHPAAAVARFGLSARARATLAAALDRRLSYPEASRSTDDPDTLRDVLYTLALMRHLDLGPAHWPFGVARPASDPPASRQRPTDGRAPSPGVTPSRSRPGQ